MSYTRHDPDRAALQGWKWLSDNTCPRRIVVKRHLGSDCWCWNPLNDHGATWQRHGERFVAWQPYGRSVREEFTSMLASAEQDGLRVALAPATWSFPGEPSACVAITFHRS